MNIFKYEQVTGRKGMQNWKLKNNLNQVTWLQRVKLMMQNENVKIPYYPPPTHTHPQEHLFFSSVLECWNKFEIHITDFQKLFY